MLVYVLCKCFSTYFVMLFYELFTKYVGVVFVQYSSRFEQVYEFKSVWNFDKSVYFVHASRCAFLTSLRASRCTFLTSL